MKDDTEWWKNMECKSADDKGDSDLVRQIEKLKKEIEELKAQLARSKEDHQYDNLVHQKELESLKNPIHDLRKKGLM